MTTHEIERREIELVPIEPANPRTLRGIAVPYGALSHVLNDRAKPYRERFDPGSVEYDDRTVMAYGHDLSGVPLGRVGAGTLAFQETAEGLAFSVELPESRADIVEALRRGDLDGSVSVGFIAKDDRWQNRTNPAVRTVRSAILVELSICHAGAYPTAQGIIA